MSLVVLVRYSELCITVIVRYCNVRYCQCWNLGLEEQIRSFLVQVELGIPACGRADINGGGSSNDDLFTLVKVCYCNCALL
jgi:hypothetical protein